MQEDIKPVSLANLPTNYFKPHKPCRECPFMKTAAPGFFGPYTGEQFKQLAHSENLCSCHMTITEDHRKERHCTGIALYRYNVCKEPRDEPLRQHQDACASKYPTDQALNFKSFMSHHKLSA